MKKLPGEIFIEDRMFFILFKDLIEEIGYTYFYVESNEGNVLYFGLDKTIEDVKMNGLIFHQQDELFRKAYTALLKIQIQIFNAM